MNQAMPTDKAKISSYIDPQLKQDFERLCEVDARTISNYVELLIREAVQKAKAEGKI